MKNNYIFKILLFALFLIFLSCDRIFITNDFYFEKDDLNNYQLNTNQTNILKIIGYSKEDSLVLKKCKGAVSNFSIFEIPRAAFYDFFVIDNNLDTLATFTQFLSQTKNFNNLEITMLDVAQGDCFIIKKADEIALLDGGFGSFGHYSWQGNAVPILKNYLYQNQIYSAKFLIESHHDLDHYGGLYDLKDDPNFSYDNYIYGEDCGYQILDNIYLTSDIFFEVIFANQRGNNESLVLMLKYQDFDLLFTGDIEEETEEIILSENLNLDCEILKVAHHGSSSSSKEEFLKSCLAQDFLISAGRNNPYHHPTQITLEKLKSNPKANLFRTDINGTVKIISDGKSYQLIW